MMFKNHEEIPYFRQNTSKFTLKTNSPESVSIPLSDVNKITDQI